MAPEDEPVRDLDDGKAWLRDRLARRTFPFSTIDPGVATRGIDRLRGLAPEPWVATWSSLADAAEVEALAAEESGANARAQAAWMTVYECAYLGRYPVPSHPAKLASYERARSAFVRGTAYDNPPLEQVRVPLSSDVDEGQEVVFYVSRPPHRKRPPVVMLWGGIDTWKEEAYGRGAPLRAAGIATILIDMPGVGEAPLLAGPDAERMWTPIFDWVENCPWLDGSRVATLGLSFGGYWAMKLAYTHAERLAAAVNWGGGVHITFQPEWQQRSRGASSYLMDLMVARARLFGGTTFDDYVANCSQLSLLSQGLLDSPSAPLLLVNGKEDRQNATEDIYLSLEHGDPKSVRIFPGGHMGKGPVMETIVHWLASRLDA